MDRLMYSSEEVNQILFDITLEKAKAEEKLKKIEKIVAETENQHYELQGKKVVMNSLAYDKIKGIIENG